MFTKCSTRALQIRGGTLSTTHQQRVNCALLSSILSVDPAPLKMADSVFVSEYPDDRKMADSVLPSTEYSLWMMLNVFIRIFNGSSTTGLDWMSPVEETGDIRLSLLDSVDRFWPLFVSSLDPERPVFKDVTIFWTKCSFVLSRLWSLNISSQDLKALCKVSAGSELDRLGEGALDDLTGSSTRDLELLLLNPNVFMSFDINFLLDFFTVPGLQPEHELSEERSIPDIPWSLLEWWRRTVKLSFWEGWSFLQPFINVVVGKTFWQWYDNDVFELVLVVDDWCWRPYTRDTFSLSIILSRDSTEKVLDGTDLLENDEGYEMLEDKEGEDELDVYEVEDLGAPALDGDSKELSVWLCLGMYFISKEADKSFQNGRVNFRRWSFIALIPRRTLGYVASSSLMMGIIFLLFASTIIISRCFYL